MSLAPAPSRQEVATLTMASRQDLSAADRLREWFLACDGDARIDASAVEILTTPAIQVLIAGSDMIRRKGWRLRIVNPSAAFSRCLSDLGTDIERLALGPRPKGGT